MIRLNVKLRFDDKNTILVGQLADDNRQLYFQYDQNFLNKGLWLSPYKLPLDSVLFSHKDTDFNPIFGLFDDSLPDGWGLLLMDRYFIKKGYDIDSISILDRLAFLGENTMGALVYEPVLDLKPFDTSPFNLHNLSVQSIDILCGKVDEVLPQLLNAGGSPGGARPKVLVGVSKDTIISGETELPEGYEHWIVKFIANNDFPDAGLVEYAYSLMAKDAGIKMAETRMFNTPEGDHFFGIKRFDREKKKRFHVHTFGNLIHSNFRIPSQDYDHFFKLVINITKNYQDLILAFKQMIFNILAHNRDDHVKNFSFLMTHEGEWSLSPAYDLTYSTGPGGEHSMTVLGEGKTPTKNDVNKLGMKHGIKQREINHIIEEVSSVVIRFYSYARDIGVSSGTAKKIASGIDRNFKIFYK